MHVGKIPTYSHDALQRPTYPSWPCEAAPTEVKSKVHSEGGECLIGFLGLADWLQDKKEKNMLGYLGSKLSDFNAEFPRQ